jgi:hypothetical protein
MASQKVLNLLKFVEITQNSVNADSDTFLCSINLVNAEKTKIPKHCSSISCFKCPFLVCNSNVITKLNEIVST